MGYHAPAFAIISCVFLIRPTTNSSKCYCFKFELIICWYVTNWPIKLNFGENRESRIWPNDNFKKILEELGFARMFFLRFTNPLPEKNFSSPNKYSDSSP